MDIFTVKEVAEKLKVDVETVRRYIWKNELKAFKLVGEWRIKEQDLEIFMDKKTNF